MSIAGAELNNSVDSDVGDYSILVYETQDAFHHSQGLRQKLKLSNEKLREKTKTLEDVVKENQVLKSELLRVSKEKSDTEELYNKKINDIEENLINMSGRNEWLEGKTEELKELCKIWKNKSLYKDKKIDSTAGQPSKPIPKLKFIADEIIAAKKRELLEKIQSVNKKNELKETQIHDENSASGESFHSVSEEPGDKTLIADPKHENNYEEEIPTGNRLTAVNEGLEGDENDEKTKLKESENDIDDKNQTIYASDSITKPEGNEIEDEEKQRDGLAVPIHTILQVSKKNDTSVNRVISYCQSLIQQNTSMLQKVCEQSQKTSVKLESWIESYMILKRNTEQEGEIHDRELKKSLKTEKEYKIQIQNLCEMITRLTKEVTSAREEIKVYEASFQRVASNLERLDNQFELIADVTRNKMTVAEERLRILLKKFNHADNSPSLKKKTPTKRFAKNLFRLKRRLSESNESLQQQ